MGLMSLISTARKNGFDSYHAVKMVLSGQINHVPSPKKQTKTAGKKPNEKNDKYNTKLLYSTAFIPRFA